MSDGKVDLKSVDEPRDSLSEPDSSEEEGSGSTLEGAINDAAKKANTIWTTFVVTMTYFFVATFTVTQFTLLKNAPVKLPILNVDLPLTVYFLLTPSFVVVLHFYCTLQLRAVVEKIERYETELFSLRRPRSVVLQQLDISCITRVASERLAPKLGVMTYAQRLVLFSTTVVFPLGLLVILQLQFLPYQDELSTWAHRAFIIADSIIAGSFWLYVIIPPRMAASKRSRLKRLVFACGFTCVCCISVFIFSFPGERIYGSLYESLLGQLTRYLLDTKVDYVNRGGSRFSNRIILIDQPALGGAPLSLRGRHLRNAVLDRTDLSGADFSAADLSLASLRGAILKGATFECTTPDPKEPMAGVGAKVVGSLDCTNLRQADLSFADLREASFESASMEGAVLVQTKVDKTRFDRAQLYGADLSQSEGLQTSFQASQLQGATLSHSRLILANFFGAGLQGAELMWSVMYGSSFDHAHAQGASFQYASLQGATFRQAMLQNSSYEFAGIQAAAFSYSSLFSANLKCSKVFRADFGGAIVSKAIYDMSGCEYGYSYDTFDYSYPLTSAYDSTRDQMPPTSDAVGVWTDVPDPKGEAETKLKAWNGQSKDEYELMIAKLSDELPDNAKKDLRTALSDLDPKNWNEDREKKHREQSPPFDPTYNVAEFKAALVERLTDLACRELAGPYVAYGMLRSDRFRSAAPYDVQAIVGLASAANQFNKDCPGAYGVVPEVFERLNRRSDTTPK